MDDPRSGSTSGRWRAGTSAGDVGGTGAASVQRALLPSSVPLLRTVDLAAAYSVAGQDQAAGGDWFDATVAPDGRLWLHVGDVVGHGIDASAAMCQMRAVLAARSLDGAGPGEALGSLDRYALVAASTFATTVCLVVLDPSSGSLEYVTRGHLPPLVVGPHGMRALPLTHGGPIGADGGGTVGTARLADDEGVLLLTDGVVERTGATLDAGLAEVARTVARLVGERAPAGTEAPTAAAPGLAERLALGTLHAAPGAADDDATALCALRRPAPAGLDLTVAAEPTSLVAVRREVDRWARLLGVPDDDRALLVLAASETTANSIEHAYGQDEAPGPGAVRVSGRLDDAVLRLEVADDGRWRPPTPDPGDRGRGLAMIAAGGARLTIDRSGPGTSVRVELDARRPVRITVAPHTTPRVPAAATSRVATDGGSVVVDGPLDTAASVAALERAIWRQSRGAALPVTIHVGTGTFLGSLAVSALARVAREGARQGGSVEIVVPPETSAALTLALAGTPASVRPTAEGAPTL